MPAEQVRNKVKFTVNDVDGQDKEFAIVRPNRKQIDDAQRVYNRAFRDAIESGAIVRALVVKIMREQKLWDDAKQEQYLVIQVRLEENARKLAAGGIKKGDAKECAIQMRRDRIALRNLMVDHNDLDAKTAEAQADNRRFNYFVSQCMLEVTPEGAKAYFKNYDDYLERCNEKAALEGALQLMNMIHGVDSDAEKQLPENKFLIKYGFVNDVDLHLVDKQGRPVDTEGRLVDKNGRFINEAGEFINSKGERVDDVGDPIIEFKEFLDDDEVVKDAVKKAKPKESASV